MTLFDESKVINALHPEKAEVGKKYYFNDSIYLLKCAVEGRDPANAGVLASVDDGASPFEKMNECSWEYVYPYEEEQQKKRMTYRQLSEWLAKGNGQYTADNYLNIYTELSYYNSQDNSNDEVSDGCTIRAWGSDEWIEPTVDVYLRDCKHISQDEIDDIAYRDGC